MSFSSIITHGGTVQIPAQSEAEEGLCPPVIDAFDVTDQARHRKGGPSEKNIILSYALN